MGSTGTANLESEELDAGALKSATTALARLVCPFADNTGFVLGEEGVRTQMIRLGSEPLIVVIIELLGGLIEPTPGVHPSAVLRTVTHIDIPLVSRVIETTKRYDDGGAIEDARNLVQHPQLSVFMTFGDCLS